ncbi:hypothetical protein [Ruegeria lacuscaerulensis]|uniref:hypothetical protein n=1 Tax=Ruegeria lacuscaerulensis TaxID=55218 RepID=UPI0014817623|nr:hypothetical protein [Ruegeria lacuscaerulensis]
MTPQHIAMRRSGTALVATGVLFTLTALPALHSLAHIFLTVAYWPIHSVAADITVPAPLLLAIVGGLTAGLGAMQWALGTYVVPISPAAAAKVAQITAWVWFCTDSTGSVLVGAPLNVALNISFLLLILWSSRPQPDENP